MNPTHNRRIVLGAAFLMATSAVGPGFLTQTTVFTQTSGASFGFVILTSIIIDVAVQLNIWRIIAVSGKRAQEIANLVLPGLGGCITVLIVLGGLAFNMGNIAGAGLGFNALLGMPTEAGAVLAAALSIGIFLVKEAKRAMDVFAQAMGVVMILLIVYVTLISAPPVEEALVNTFLPQQVDFMAIVTLVGGTVGGYITFSGGHRLLDAGIKGKEALPQVSRSAVSGILVASVIRVFLFLATLGVVSKGLIVDAGNPPASVFRLAAGELGYKLFGIMILAAAITSVIGSAYTSVSFIRSFSPLINRFENWTIIGFITVSTVLFILLGRPVLLLILAGSLNGLILPITLGTFLLAAYRTKITGVYRHPIGLTLLGIAAVLVMAWMGGHTLVTQIAKLFVHSGR